MSAQETSIGPFKADQQTFEFVHPSKSVFGTKAMLVDLGIEKSLATAFDLFSIAWILWNSTLSK